MSLRRVAVLGAVVAIAVTATVLLRSHGGRQEAPIPESPPRLEPETAPAAPQGPDPARAAPPTAAPTPANAQPPSPVPAEERPDPSAPNVRARALHDTLAGATSDEARLYADLRRAGRPVPPEAGLLVEMKRAGASAADLASYVRRSFPDDPITRATALKWIRINVPGELPPGADAGSGARTRIFRTPPGP